MSGIFRVADRLDDLNTACQQFLNHWAFAVPVFLIVAAAAFPFIDRFAPTVDEFSSLHNAGWLSGRNYTVQEVAQSVRDNVNDHLPAYFITLSLWGQIVAQDIAMARLLSVLVTLLALAFIWRLAADFVAPAAGTVSAMLLASNAYFNWYVIHARMYPLIILVFCIGLWLYLRIQYGSRQPNFTGYLALFCTVFVFCFLHFSNLLCIVALGVFHVVSAPKRRRWFYTTAAVLIACALFAPYATYSIETLTEAVKVRQVPELELDAIGAIWFWFKIVSNNTPVLLILPLAGFVLALQQRDRRQLLWLAILGIYLLALAATAQFSTVVVYRTMRYYLAALPIAICALAAGMLAWDRHALWLFIFALVICALGVKWQRSGDWRDLLWGRYYPVHTPPTQVISRLAQQAQPPPGFVIHLGEWTYQHLLNYGDNNRWFNLPMTQAEYYFAQHGIEIISLQSAQDSSFSNLNTSTPIWLVYRAPMMTPEIQLQIDGVMNRLAYRPRDKLRISNDTVIVKYGSHQTTVREQIRR